MNMKLIIQDKSFPLTSSCNPLKTLIPNNMELQLLLFLALNKFNMDQPKRFLKEQ